MVAHRGLVRARPYAGPAQQFARRGRIRGRRSAVRSSSCGGQVLSRQPLGQRPSLYVVILRGLSCLGKPGWSSLAGSFQNRFGDGVENHRRRQGRPAARWQAKAYPATPPRAQWWASPCPWFDAPFGIAALAGVLTEMTAAGGSDVAAPAESSTDRKSTRLNSSHLGIS